MFPVSLQKRVAKQWHQRKETTAISTANEAAFHFFQEKLKDIDAPNEISAAFGGLYLTSLVGAEGLPIWILSVPTAAKLRKLSMECDAEMGCSVLMRPISLADPIDSNFCVKMRLPHLSGLESGTSVTLFRLVVSTLSSFSDSNSTNSDLSSAKDKKEVRKKQRGSEKITLKNGDEGVSSCTRYPQEAIKCDTLTAMVPYCKLLEKGVRTFQMQLNVKREYFPILGASLTPSTSDSANSSTKEPRSSFSYGSSLLDDVNELISQMRKREGGFLLELAELFRSLISLLRDGKKGQDTEKSEPRATPLSCNLSVQVTVPLYQIRFLAHDTAETRLSTMVSNVLERIIDSVITAEYSMCHLGTIALQWLFYVSNNALPLSLRAAEVFLELIQSEEKNLRSINSFLCSRSDILHSLAPFIHASDSSLPTAGDGVDGIAEKMFSLPSAVVHCRQGVSRSPSVVMCYIIRRWAPFFRKSICKRREQLAGLASKDLGPKKKEGTVGMESTSSYNGDSTSDGGEKLFFQDFLSSFRKFRPMILPNACFAAELHSIWRALVLDKIN